MEKQDINALITQAKSSNKSKTIQKIVPITTKETEEMVRPTCNTQAYS